MTNAIILEPFIIEQIAPSVTREWSADRRLVIYTLEDERRPTLDAWLTSLEGVSLHWAEGQPMRMCYEFLTGRNPQSARYVLRRLGELNAKPHPAFKIYSAFVIPNAFLVGAIQVMAMPVLLAKDGPLPVKLETFTDRAKALAWLIAQPD